MHKLFKHCYNMYRKWYLCTACNLFISRVFLVGIQSECGKIRSRKTQCWGTILCRIIVAYLVFYASKHFSATSYGIQRFFLDRFTLIYILTELRNSLFKNQNKSKMKLEKAVTQTCSVKKVFLKIYQNLQQKHMCLSLFFNEVTGSNFIKKRRRYRYFPLNVA